MTLDKEWLIEFLSRAYAVAVATVPLLKTALQEPMPDELREYYTRKIEQERDHDKWIIRDLKLLGSAPYLVDWRFVPLVGSQYYLIKHVAPECLLGFMTVFEQSPMPLEMVAQLEEAHGIEPVRTIRFHAEHDLEHGPEVLHMIESLGDKIDQELVRENAQHTAKMLNEVLESVIRNGR